MIREIGCIHNRSKTEVWMCGACAFKHIEALRLAERRIAELSPGPVTEAPAGLDATIAKMENEGRDDGSARDAILSAVASHRRGSLDGWELHLVLSRLDAASSVSAAATQMTTAADEGGGADGP